MVLGGCDVVYDWACFFPLFGVWIGGRGLGSGV